MLSTRICRQTIFFLALLIISIFSGQRLSAQEEPVETQEPDMLFFQAGYQLRSMPGAWHVNYFGLLGEVPITKKFGLSGSLLYGRGSNNTGYLHLPVPGVLLFIGLSTIFGPEAGFLQTLVVEDVHYYHWINEKLVVSPYLNILGADLAESTGGEYDDKSHTILSWGPGVSVRIIPAKHFTVAADFGIKHYIVKGKDDFGYGNRLGFTMGVNIGIVF